MIQTTENPTSDCQGEYCDLYKYKDLQHADYYSKGLGVFWFPVSKSMKTVKTPDLF